MVRDRVTVVTATFSTLHPVSAILPRELLFGQALGRSTPTILRSTKFSNPCQTPSCGLRIDLYVYALRGTNEVYVLRCKLAL